MICVKHTVGKSVNTGKSHQIRPNDVIKVIKRVSGGYLCVHKGIRLVIEKEVVQRNFKKEND